MFQNLPIFYMTFTFLKYGRFWGVLPKAISSSINFYFWGVSTTYMEENYSITRAELYN